MPKPGIDDLLIRSALDPALRRRLIESADDAFQDFELTEEQKEILRAPDHRMLDLFAAALARQSGGQTARAAEIIAEPPQPQIRARMLPDLSLALTLVPCLREKTSELAYAAWVTALPEGTDPASLAPPPGATLPGRPITPLYATVRVSAQQFEDAAGNLQIGLSASFERSSNMAGPRANARGVETPEVQSAVARVRSAAGAERRTRLLELIRAMRGGEAQ